VSRGGQPEGSVTSGGGIGVEEATVSVGAGRATVGDEETVTVIGAALPWHAVMYRTMKLVSKSRNGLFLI